MSTFIHSPQCNHEISETAIACPKCGALIENDKEIQNKIDSFIAVNHKYFPQQNIPQIIKLLSKNPDKITMAMHIGYKNPIIAFLLSFFFTVGRFYIGDIVRNLVSYLLIFFAFIAYASYVTPIYFILLWLLWWFVDSFIIMGDARKRNYIKLLMFLANY
jgi:hypothetical protein